MKVKYFEEYCCGCCSDYAERRKDLLGYCPVHGADRRAVFKFAQCLGVAQPA